MTYGYGGYGFSGFGGPSSFDDPMLGHMLDGLVLGVEAQGFDIAILRDALQLAADTSTTLHALGTMGDTVALNSALAPGWAVSFADTLVMGSTASPNPLLVAVMRDILVATGAASGSLTALGAMAVGLVLNATTQPAFKGNLADAVEFNAAASSQLIALGQALDALQFGTSLTPALRLVAIAQDTLELATTPAGILTQAGLMQDSLLLYTTLRIGSEDFVAWVWNTANRAPSEYTNHPFDSFETFGTHQYAAGEGGIFEFGGSTDDGDDFQQRLRTGLMDFLQGQGKRIPQAFYAVTGEGDFVLKVITTDRATGEKIEDWYRSPMPAHDGVQEGTIGFGRGLRARYWQFELVTVENARVAFADLALAPISLTRRT